MAATSRMIERSTRFRGRSFMAQPFKHPTSGVFYIRRRVPRELQPALGREFKRSLDTRDPDEAKARFAAAWIQSEEVFSLARAQLSGTTTLTPRDMQQLASRWFKQELSHLEKTGEFESYLVQGSTVLNEGPGGYQECQCWVSLSDAPSEGIEVDPTETTLPYVRRTLQTENIPMPPTGSKTLADLTQAFWSHLLRLSDLAKLRHEGNWITRASVLEHEPLSIQQRKPECKTLLAAFEAYSEAKLLDDGDNRSTRKTLDEFGGTVRRFVELFGDLALTNITRATIQEYRSKLAMFPAKAKGAAKLTAHQLLAVAEANQLPTLSHATVRNKLRALSAVLGYAVRLDWIRENPVEASGIAKAASRAASANSIRKRKDYSLVELTQIFQSPAFSQPDWRLPRRDFGRAFYWLPLLMYYTGARREEVAQLRARDALNSEEEVPYLSILATQGDDDGGRTVKTLGSRRKVPLHPDLITLGFLEYAKAIPPDGQLFPKLKPNPAGYYGVNWGRAWAHYLRSVIGLDCSASPAHGFRHTFKTLCRQQGIPEDVHDAITGHSNGSVGRDYGTMPLKRIAQELSKLPQAPLS